MKSRLFLSIFILIGSLCENFGHAETMNLDATQVVISKLEKLLQYTDPNEPGTKVSLSLRLADLYSDRARLEEQTEQYDKAKADRIRALKTYEGVNAAIKDQDTKSRTASQMAHLYQLTDQKEKATKLYKSILANKSRYSVQAVSQAYMDMGEIALSKQKYNNAEKNFEKAKIDHDRIMYAQTRIAWCRFHMGQLQTAIKNLKSVLTNASIDNTLKENASRDLATFLAQKPKVSTQDIQDVANFSPASARDSNLTYFANELDRLGKKTAALLVWHSLQGQSKKDKEFSEHLELAQIQYDLGHKKEAANELGLFYADWAKLGCKKEETNCDLLKARSRKLITDWAASEERTPSVPLVNAFIAYNNLFSESEMAVWGAQAAKKVKLWNESFNLYDLCAKNQAKSSGTAKDSKLLEGCLVGQIDVAESATPEATSNELRTQAYRNYLDLNPKGAQASQVKYQTAHLIYEKKDFVNAATSFHDLALDQSITANIRSKSADISIESLLAPHDAAISQKYLETWARDYAAAFPQRRAEYQKLGRQAMLNRMAGVINDSKASNSALESSLTEMSQVSLISATPQEKIAFYKNRAITAEKLKNLPEMKKAIIELLTVRGLSSADRVWALGRLEWAYEMGLEFKDALRIAKTLKMSELSQEQRLQKMSFLSELAGENLSSDGINKYDKELLKVSHSKRIRLAIISKLIKKSKNPEQVITRYYKELNQSPLALSELTLEVFAKTKNWAFAQKMLKNRAIARTHAGGILARYVFLNQFSTVKNSARFTSLKQPIQKSLSSNLRSLRTISNETKKAIRSGDWTSQVVSLTELRDRNTKLGSAIAHLPVPKKLSAQNRLRYQALLNQQASPYLIESDKISQKLMTLWSEADLLQLTNSIKVNSSGLRDMVLREIKTVLAIAPEGFANTIRSNLASAQRELKPVTEEINQTVTQLKKQPFDESLIEELRALQEKAGHPVYVAYLDGRLLQLKKGAGQ